MIPGFVIGWVTFPGVIVHEFAHTLFCRLLGLKIYEVKYFRFSIRWGQPAGYVISEISDKAWKNALVGIGPFFVNTILGAIIAAPAAIPIFEFSKGDALDYFLLWLGVSIAMHSFPSTGDARYIWKSVTARETSSLTKALTVPLIGLIYIGAFGSVFWLDALYGIAVAGFVPKLIVTIFS